MSPLSLIKVPTTQHPQQKEISDSHESWLKEFAGTVSFYIIFNGIICKKKKKKKRQQWLPKLYCKNTETFLVIIWLWGRLNILPRSLERLWRRLMVEKLTLNSLATALVDIPGASMPIARSLTTGDICGIVLCDKTAHLEWPFIVASLRHTCAIIMLSNQHLDMSHLWGGWIISAKEKCSLTQI